MLITVKTFDGHNINDGSSYSAKLDNPLGSTSANPVFLEQSNNDAIDAGRYTVDTQVKVLTIKILDYANRYSLIAQLKTWMKRGTRGNLVVHFADDNTDYLVDCRVVSLTQDGNYLAFKAVLQTAWSAWRAVTESTDTWSVTGTGGTHDITVAGKDETYLSLDLLASSGPASGYLYQQLYRLPNVPGLNLGTIPWCITLNTATLVSGGKMQSDCDDLRVVNLATGQEIHRWIANPNNASTKVWVSLNLVQGYSLPLATAIVGTGDITELQFTVTDTLRLSMAVMPRTGIVYHGNEWFSYTQVDEWNCKLIVGQRGLFGTTKESHSAAVNFLYIQYPLLIKYGNSSVSAPSTGDSTYDNDKPMIDLANSSNTSWVWGAGYPFIKTNPAYSTRTAAWKTALRKLGYLTGFFDYKQKDPANLNSTYTLGMEVTNFPISLTEDCEFLATFYHPAGCTVMAATGDKWRSNANWLGTTGFRTSLDGVTYSDWFAIVSPLAASGWESWSQTSSTPTGTKYVQMVFAGTYPPSNKLSAYLEMLTCTMTINSSNLPSGSLLGEVAAYPFVGVIKNNTTGDTLSANYPMLINKTFSIDGENSVVQYDGYNAFGSLLLDDESRSVYIRLQAGTNTISITGTDLGTLSVTAHWYVRRL